jgi:hypothetical protein
MTIPMLRVQRRGLCIASSLLFALTLASSAAARQVAYVSATPDEPCDATTPTCNRGVISIVNTSTNQVLGSMDVWRGVPQGVLTFRALLVEPTGRRLYAVLDRTIYRSQDPFVDTLVRVFDTRTRSQLTEFSLRPVGTECVFSADGDRLFCTRYTLGNDVAVIDTATNTVLTTIPAVLPKAIATSPSGSLLYIAHADNRVTILDSTTYTLLATVVLPATPLTLGATSDGLHLYAALNDRSIADIDATTDTIAGVIPDVTLGGNLPLDVTFAKGKAYVTTGAGTAFPDGLLERVTVIDVASRTVITRIGLTKPLEAETSLDESRVFVARESGLSVIDTSTNQVVASTPLPDGPGRLALSPPPPFAGVIIDAPVQGARVQQPFNLGGWAVDVFGSTAGPGIDTVHVWAFPANGASPMFVGAAEYGRPRPDIAGLFGAPYLNSGYQLTVRGLTPGAYTLTAFGHSTRTGTFSVARQVSITVTTSLRMAIDAPVTGASVPTTFVVAGWALDGSAATGSGIDAVHVWAYPSTGAAPIFAGAATLGYARPDVAAAFGSQFDTTGYALDVQNLSAGSYTLIVYAHQASSGTFAAERAVRVTVTAPRPFIFIDVPAMDATGGTSVRVAGWAIEVGAATGSGVDAVHVWAYPSSGGSPVLVGVASYGTARPDVGAIFGSRYTPSAFDVTGSLPAGTYNIVAFAHSTTTNSFAGVRSVRVTVQ